MNAFINESFRVKNTVIQPLTRIAKETHYIKDLKIEKGICILTKIKECLYQHLHQHQVGMKNFIMIH